MGSIRNKILKALEKGQKVNEKGSIIRRKRKKKCLFSKEDVDKFIILYRVQSRYKYELLIETLAREGKPYPSKGNIIKYYKNWEEIRTKIFGKVPVTNITPPEIINILIKFNINNVRSLMKLKKEQPDILPGYNAILEIFGSYKILFRLKKALSLKDNAETYLKLLDKYQRTPTYNECIEAGIDLNRMANVFSGQKKFDIFMHNLKKIRDNML